MQWEGDSEPTDWSNYSESKDVDIYFAKKRRKYASNFSISSKIVIKALLSSQRVQISAFIFKFSKSKSLSAFPKIPTARIRKSVMAKRNKSNQKRDWHTPPYLSRHHSDFHFSFGCNRGNFSCCNLGLATSLYLSRSATIVSSNRCEVLVTKSFNM